MSDDFNDIDIDDVWGTEPADPEQVAIKLHELRREALLEDRDWRDLDDDNRGRRLLVAAVLLEWGRRQGVFR